MNTLESGLSGENPLYLILSTLNTRKIKIIKRRKLRRGGGRGEVKKREESGYVRGRGGGQGQHKDSIEPLKPLKPFSNINETRLVIKGY